MTDERERILGRRGFNKSVAGTFIAASSLGSFESVSAQEDVATDTTVYVGGSDGLYAVDALTGERVWWFETGNYVYSSPTVVSGSVYFNSPEGLYSVTADTGDEIWKFTGLNGESVSGGIAPSPTVVDNTVYIGSVYGSDTDSIGNPTDYQGSIYAVDSQTGEEVWEFAGARGGIPSSPTVVDGTVYAGSFDLTSRRTVSGYNIDYEGYIYAIDSQTGEEVWEFTGTSGTIISSPTVVDETLYIGDYEINIDTSSNDVSTEGSLYAIDSQTGEEVWEFTGTSGTITSSPIVVDGTVYIQSDYERESNNANYERSLYAIDSETGDLVWEFVMSDGGGRSTPTVVDGTVYVGSDNNSLYAVDAETGDEVWRFTEPSGQVQSSPTVMDGTVYVGSNDRTLYAVDAETGDEQWRFTKPSEAVLSSPTVVRNPANGSSIGSRVLLGTLGHHNVFAENGPTQPGEVGGGGTGRGGTGGAGTGSPEQGSSGGTGDGSGQSGDTDTPTDGGSGGVLDGFATMFREPSESAGLWGLLLGGGVLGSGYLAYRRRDSDDEEDKTVAKECPECGSRVDATKDFCGNCGAQVDGREKEDRQKTESAETVNVSSYEEFSTGEVVETGSGYQVQEANLDSSERSVWVVTPSAEGGQTLNVSNTEAFLEDIEPWTKMDNHPNLLQIYGHGTEPLPWLATEAGDYPHILEVADELSVEEKIDVVTQVCEAVHHVHRYGITYQDLSIDSVTVTDGTKVKLRGPLNYLNGTSDSEVTEQTVIYNIGSIAKELLTGPSAGNVPEEVWQEIDRALSEDPSNRHDTVLHLRDSLSQAFYR
jgi:outer membrane protein assembly factor BamB